MPNMFPSGQFPPGACGQVRPVGATLPTAARRAPSREAADGYTCPQGQAAATPAWTCGVDRCKISTFLTGVIPVTFAVRH